MVKYVHHAKTSNFIENFEFVIVLFGSIRISGPLSGEYISGVRSGTGPGHSIWASDLGSVLSGLIEGCKFEFNNEKNGT